MTTTYNPPRILILLIQIERDHLSNWQALLPVLPLNSPQSGARGIQGAKAVSVTTPHLLLRALCGLCTATAVQGQKITGDGARPTWNKACESPTNSMEKASMPAFRVHAAPHSHCMMKGY